jgi:hypothetical protein
MVDREVVVELICVFLVTLLGATLIYLPIYLGDLSWNVTVIFFGLTIPVWIPYLLMIAGLGITIIVLSYIYYREWRSSKLRFSYTKIVLYLLLIAIATSFVVLTHFFLLPDHTELQNLIFDIWIVLEVFLLVLMLGFLISIARGDIFTVISFKT